MEDSTIISQVVQQQATVGQILNDYINGVGISAIGEKYGVAPEKIRDVVQQADREGRFVPKGVEVPIDKVSDTPAVEPIVEGESPQPMVSTSNSL